MKKIKKLVCITPLEIMMASTVSGYAAKIREITSALEQKKIPYKNGAKDPAAENLARSPTAEGPETEESVSFRFVQWNNNTRHGKTVEMVRMYQKKHPNMATEPEYRGRPERKKVAAELGSSTSANIVQLGPPQMGDFVFNSGLFMNLGQYGYNIGGFSKKLIDNYCTYNGTLIALPSSLNARCYIMNKTKLDELGIPSGLDTT